MQSQVSAVIGRGWMRVGIAVDLALSSPTAIPFCLCQSGRGEYFFFVKFGISQLKITAAGMSGLLLQDLWQLQAFTHYCRNLNSSAVTRP